MKKLLLFFMVLASFMLYGCQKDTAGEELRSDNTASGYTLRVQELPGNTASSSAQFFDGDTVYFCARELDETPILGKLSDAGFYGYPVPEGVSYLHTCCMAEDALAVVAGDFPAVRYDSAGQFCENPQKEYALYLLRYDGVGELIEQLRIDLADLSGINVSSLRYLDGYYYLLSPNALIQIDSRGQVRNSICSDGLSFISQCIVQGRLAVCCYDVAEGTTKVSFISSDAERQLETVFSDASMIVSGVGASGRGELLLIADHALYSYSMTENALKKVCDFYACGVTDTEYSGVFEVGENYMLCRSFQKNITGLVYGEASEKKPLILWAFSVDKYLQKLVTGFNQTHSDYQIQIEDVSGIEESRLKARIASGAGPDLYLTGSADGFGEISREAAFEDLTPFINSSSVTEENLIMPLVSAVNSGDGIYRFPVTFVLYTAVCKEDIVPAGKMSLTELTELPQVKGGELSIFPSYFNSEGGWTWLSDLYVCKYFDAERGSCDFKTDDFITLLELSAAIDKAPPSSDVPSFFNFEWIPGTLRMLYYQQNFGEAFELDTVFGSGFSVETAFAISNTSENKEGAWEFIEYCHLADISGEGFSLPASAVRLERLLEEARTSGVWWPETRQYIPLSGYTCDMLKDAIYRTKNQYAGDEVIRSIMREEANKFFAGDRSAEETADAVQSRVNIYLSERFE